MTTWVGLAKIELAFHGDALNSAARLQSLSSHYDEECLISGYIAGQITLPSTISSSALGTVELKGKGEPMDVLALREDGRS